MKTIKNCQGTMEICLPLEIGVDTVYVRENIKRVTFNEMEMWQYDETQYSIEEYNSFKVTELSSIPANQLIIKEVEYSILPESGEIEEVANTFSITLRDDITKVSNSPLKYKCNEMKFTRNKSSILTSKQVAENLYFSMIPEMFIMAETPESSAYQNRASSNEIFELMYSLTLKVKVLEEELKTIKGGM